MGKGQDKFRNKDGNDVMVPWCINSKTTDNKTFYRYYHLFNENELIELINALPYYKNVEITESGYQKDNYYVILRKLAQ